MQNISVLLYNAVRLFFFSPKSTVIIQYWYHKWAEIYVDIFFLNTQEVIPASEWMLNFDT